MIQRAGLEQSVSTFSREAAGCITGPDPCVVRSLVSREGP